MHPLYQVIGRKILERGLDPANATEIYQTNPDLNALRLKAESEIFAYRRTADEARALLTKAQRRSWAACGPFKNQDGTKNQVHANRSIWLCWLWKRAGCSLALTPYLRRLIVAEYHHMTVKEFQHGCAYDRN